MSTQTALEPVDLSKYTFAPDCETCGKQAATVVAQGCADKHPVLMCEPCLERGLEVISMFIHMYQRFNKRICVCGDCYRPILHLDTHLEVRRLT